MDEYSQDYPAEYGQEEHVYTGEELSGYEDYAPEQTAQKPSKKKKKRRRKKNPQSPAKKCSCSARSAIPSRNKAKT